MNSQINKISDYLNSFPNLYGKRGLNSNIWKMITPEIKKQIEEIFAPIKSSSGKLYCCINKVFPVPVCKICNKNYVTFSEGKLLDVCSLQCSRKTTKTKLLRNQTNIELNNQDPGRQTKIQEKKKKTNLKKYGVDWSAQSKEIQEKIRKKINETYADRKGEIISLRKQTFNASWGADHPMKTERCKTLLKTQIQKKYGVDFATQITGMSEKSKKTFQQKYGNNIHCAALIPCIQEKRKAKYQLITEQNLKNFEDQLSNYNTAELTRPEIAKIMSLPVSSCNNYIRQLNIPVKELIQQKTSGIELDVQNFLTSLNISYETNNRQILNGKELDIYIPSHNLAIEIDGVYWHTEEFGKDENYHLEKTQKCLEKGIQLLHIFDFEWNNKKQIWQDIIKHKLGLSQKIHARKCTIMPISTSVAKEFLNKNHLQGFAGGKIKLGLHYDNELYQVIICGKSRFNKHYDYELIRAASKIGYNIVGGLSKLLSRISGSIISYADSRYSVGNSYQVIGFNFKNFSRPNYYYIINGQLESRLKYQKHKLPKILKNFDPNLTEAENMNINGFYRIWDCGNYIYSL